MIDTTIERSFYDDIKIKYPTTFTKIIEGLELHIKELNGK